MLAKTFVKWLQVVGKLAFVKIPQKVMWNTFIITTVWLFGMDVGKASFLTASTLAIVQVF
jgi:hypothetical protein